MVDLDDVFIVISDDVDVDNELAHVEPNLFVIRLWQVINKI